MNSLIRTPLTLEGRIVDIMNSIQAGGIRQRIVDDWSSTLT
jgi:hypothetical protein